MTFEELLQKERNFALPVIEISEASIWQFGQTFYTAVVFRYEITFDPKTGKSVIVRVPEKLK